MTEWQIKNRGKHGQSPLVVLPGWGFSGAVFVDHPAFASETLIVSMQYTAPDMLAGLVDFLITHKIKQVRVLGWSMGGNIGLDFILEYPEYASSLILVAVRKHWATADIALTRKGLLDATGQGMATFYRKCFLGAKTDYKLCTPLLNSYAKKHDVALLEQGLSYLETYTMIDSVPVPVHIFQGEKDVICPENEKVTFSSQTKNTTLAGAGHFVFSHVDFKI